jgi:hypothetical protein
MKIKYQVGNKLTTSKLQLQNLYYNCIKTCQSRHNEDNPLLKKKLWL